MHETRIKEEYRTREDPTSAVSENAHNTGRRRILIVNPISTHAGWKR